MDISDDEEETHDEPEKRQEVYVSVTFVNTRCAAMLTDALVHVGGS